MPAPVKDRKPIVPEYHKGLPQSFGGIDPSEFPYEQCPICILPIPYEATTSFMAGTREGPRAILNASRYMELYDEETDCELYRIGIFTLPEMETVSSSPSDMVEEIHRAAKAILADGKFLVSLGGEHTITPPLVRAVAERHPGLSVLQIDAHGDLRDSYHGSRYSHACAMRRVLEAGVSGVQVGIRSISAEEMEALPGLNTRLFFAHDSRGSGWVREAVAALGDPVYVTIDLDGLDPSIMPAVGTPEPGGLDWHQVCDLLREVAAERRVVGFDVNELAPIPGWAAADFVAAKLVYKFLNYLFADKLKTESRPS